MTYLEQNNQLFEGVINQFFKLWKHSYEEQDKILSGQGLSIRDSSLELFITPQCNQSCEYCYLAKNKDLLYPEEIRDEEQIVKNLTIFLEYCLQQGINIPRLDLFSGEIWGYSLGNEILDTIIDFILKGLRVRSVLVPSSCSFLNSCDRTQQIENYINKFQEIGSKLIFSISYDGLHLDTIQRPATIKNENYSKALFTFAQKYHFGFHPMISSYRIEEQINNYHTWIKLLYKYWPDNFSSTIGQVMQLETREQGWTDEKIQIYLQWLKYLIDTDCKQYYNGDYNKFFNNIVLRKDTSSKFLKTSYLPYSILPKPQTHLNCAFGKTLFIRLGDLSIVPCHRTSYNKFILGQFKTQNDKIIGVECNNFPLTSSIYLSGYAIKPFCNNCAISNYCNKYCIGANYETNHELFHPEQSNCNLQKAKIIFLHSYYNKLNLPSLYQETINQLKEKEPEVYNKWKTYTMKIV